MANEAICIQAPKIIVRRTVADATAIPLNSITKLADPNTVVVSSADNDVFGGIATQEKVANDGITEISCAMDGRWSLTSTGAGITAGATVNIGGANQVVASAAADLLTGSKVGRAITTQAGAGQVIVEVGAA